MSWIRRKRNRNPEGPVILFGQYVVTFLLGIGTIILGQIIVDSYRGKNRAIEKAVAKNEFEDLKKKFNKLVIKLERQGIETNGE
jgi:hypothetical protein